MRATDWIIGGAWCDHTAIARMPLSEAIGSAYRHGRTKRIVAADRRARVCPSCAGGRLATQPRSGRGAVWEAA